MTALPSRLLPLEGAFNLRDLGGYALTTGGQTQWGRALRADGLSRLTTADIDLLLGRGLSRVIDLRAPQEVAHHPGKLSGVAGVEVLNLPVFDDLAPQKIPDGAEPLPQFYRAMLENRGAVIAQIFTAIDETPEGGTVLFHCTAGKDRTGLIAALWLALAGVGRDDVIADYALTAELIPGLIALFNADLERRGVDPAAIAPMLACKPAYMESLLQQIDDSHGGVAGYLQATGLSDGTLNRLQQRLTGSSAR